MAVTATVDWSAVTVAASFVLGAVSGTVATIALMRSLMSYFDKRNH